MNTLNKRLTLLAFCFITACTTVPEGTARLQEVARVVPSGDPPWQRDDTAPGVRLRFMQKPDKDSGPLRDGTVDLETGVVVLTTAPEVRAQALFRDRFVGVVRMGHSLSKGKITSSRYAAGRHICVSRRGFDEGPIDEEGPIREALKRLGLERQIVTIVGGFSTALALARATDLIASVPERHTGKLRTGMHSFPLPVATPQFTVSLLWHPRLDADPAHRWLRGCVQDACAEPLTNSSTRARKVERGGVRSHVAARRTNRP